MAIENHLKYNLYGYLNYADELDYVPKGVGIITSEFSTFYTDGIDDEKIGDHWEMISLLSDYFKVKKQWRENIYVAVDGDYTNITVNIMPPSEEVGMTNEQIDFLVTMLKEIEDYNKQDKNRYVNVSVNLEDTSIYHSSDIDFIIELFNTKRPLGKKDSKKLTNIFKKGQ